MLKINLFKPFAPNKNVSSTRTSKNDKSENCSNPQVSTNDTLLDDMETLSNINRTDILNKKNSLTIKQFKKSATFNNGVVLVNEKPYTGTVSGTINGKKMAATYKGGKLAQVVNYRKNAKDNSGIEYKKTYEYKGKTTIIRRYKQAMGEERLVSKTIISPDMVLVKYDNQNSNKLAKYTFRQKNGEVVSIEKIIMPNEDYTGLEFWGKNCASGEFINEKDLSDLLKDNGITEEF